MTNYDNYKEDIEKLAKLNLDFALTKDTKEIVKCAGFNCKNCAFFCSIGYCSDNKIDWADKEFKESGVDWSKVPVDTKIFVKISEDDEWFPRHFAKYENGEVYVWYGGCTSFTMKRIELCSRYKHAKLAEE